MPLNIGVGMMQNIVLYFPVVHITGKNIDTRSHEFIHPIVFRERTVISIVHYVHAYPSHAHSHDYSQQ